MQEHLYACRAGRGSSLGAAAVFLITRLHEGAVHLADRYFNRALDTAERRARAAHPPAPRRPPEIDRLLADETFERAEARFCRVVPARGAGVRARRQRQRLGATETRGRSSPSAPMLAPVCDGKPFPWTMRTTRQLDSSPRALSRPVLAVPAVNPVRCFAVSLYGPHASGTDLDANERAMLARLAANAAAMYAELENSDLRGELRLERKLASRHQKAGLDRLRNAHGDL